MARVIFVFPGHNLKGGISTVVSNISKSSFCNQFSCLYYGTSTDAGCNLYKGLYSLFRIFLFPFYLLIAKPEIVSIHSASSTSFYRKLLYILFSRCFKNKVVLHVHPSEFYFYYRQGSLIRKWFVKKAISLSSHLVFLSEDIKLMFQRDFPNTPSSVIPNPVPVDIFSRLDRAPTKDNYTVLYMGWIIAEKGVYDIVDIINDTASKYPKVQFLFAGNKEIDNLRKYIIDKKVQSHAQVLGWVDGQEKLQLMATSRLLLLPSYTEGIPNVILEAMASGLPALASNVGGIPSVFEEGINGFFIKPGDRDGLLCSVLRMLSDDELCESISRQTRIKAAKFFDTEIISNKWKLLYNAINH